MQSYTTTLADVLRSALRAEKEHGASYRSICRSTGIQPITLCRFLNGKQSLALETASLLAHRLGLVLGYPVGDCVRPRGDEPPKE